MSLHNEEEGICRELGNPRGLATSLANQAELLAGDLHQPQPALPLAEEARDLAEQHGLTALAEQIKPILDSVRSMLR